MIEDKIANKIAEMVDSYLKDNDIMVKDNELNNNRKIISENEVRPLFIKFFKNKIGIDEFKPKNDGLNKKYKYWGFNGNAGAMFFNQLFNGEDDKERLEKEVRRYLLEPDDVNGAKLKIENFNKIISNQ